MVVSPAPMRAVRPHRLLRLLAVAACQPARGQQRPPADPVWFWSYADQQFYDGPPLAPPEHHPVSLPVPGPEGKVPPDWQDRLH